MENSNSPERDRSVAGEEDKRPASFHKPDECIILQDETKERWEMVCWHAG